MKKILILVLVLLFAAGISYSQDTGYPSRGNIFLQSRAISNSGTNDRGHTHIATSPSLVYRVTITSSQANTYVQLFDSNTTATYLTTEALISALGSSLDNSSGGSKTVKADVGAATAGQTYVYDFDPPLRFEYGILAGVGASSSTSGDVLDTTAKVVAVIEYVPAE